MVEYNNKLTCKKAMVFLVGVMIALMAREAPMTPSNAINPTINKTSNVFSEEIPQQTPIAVGEVVPYTMRMGYSRQANNGQTIAHPGASFIKVHFQSLDLANGDYVTVSDPDGTEIYTYPGSDLNSDGGPGFWSMSINGDTAIVQLHTQSSSRQLSESTDSKSDVIIDKYGRGYPQDEIEQILARSTCGASERMDAVCYQETNPTEFKKSNAVARLLISRPDGYYAFCTAWRVGVGATMLTNQHCLPSQIDVTSTEAWFNYQNQTCGTSSVGNVTKVTGDKLIASDLALDFTLFTINKSETVADFGFLEIDARTPVAGEQIYIPQHGGGSPKQLGIESDLNEGNVCRIDAAAIDGLDNGTDTGYYCDTAGGSSGAPVLASSSDKVIAMHHFGSPSTPNCTTLNQGVRMDLIWPQVEPYLLQVSPFGLNKDEKPSYKWNEASNATWYHLWVEGPAGKIHDKWYEAPAICINDTCSVTPDIALRGGQYTWWIQIHNSTGSGPWSGGMNFNIPVPPLPAKATLVSPADTIIADPPSYTWTQDPDATWYYLWVNGPSGNIIKKWYATAETNCNGTICSVSPDITLHAGAYTWWIQTWNAAGAGDWSNGMNFIVKPPTPASPILPVGRIEANTPTYTWHEVPGVTWYYLWVNGPSGNVIKQWYTAVQSNCNGTTCSVTNPTALSSGSHTWWVQTWNDAGPGSWSEGMSFRPTPPMKADLISPAGNTVTNNPTYTWIEVTHATWYYLWVNETSGNIYRQWYTSAQANCDGTVCSITPNISLDGGEYIWWIQTWNDVGPGPWSDGMKFLAP